MRAQLRVLAGLVTAGALVAGMTVTTVSLTASPAGSEEAQARMSGPLQDLSGTASPGVRAPANARVRPSGAYDRSAKGPGSFIERPDGLLVQVFSDDLSGALVARLRTPEPRSSTSAGPSASPR